MSEHYEIRLNTPLANLVREHLEGFFALRGFKMVLNLSTPEGPDVQEFKRSADFFSVSYRELSDSRTDIVLESSTLDVRAWFLEVAREITADLVIEFVQGLPGCQREGLAEEIRNLLEALYRKVTSCDS